MGMTVKIKLLLLFCPFTVTTTGPVVAAVGTGTVILVSIHCVGAPVAPGGTGKVMLALLHSVGEAGAPFTVTAPVPRSAPKFEPDIVTDVCAGPDVGTSRLIDGAPRETFNAVIPPELTTMSENVAEGYPESEAVIV